MISDAVAAFTFAGSAGVLPMRVEACNRSFVATTNAQFVMESDDSIALWQLIDMRRQLARWQLPAGALTDLAVLTASGDVDKCVLGNKQLAIGVQRDGLIGILPLAAPLTASVTALVNFSFSRLWAGNLLTQVCKHHAVECYIFVLSFLSFF